MNGLKIAAFLAFACLITQTAEATPLVAGHIAGMRHLSPNSVIVRGSQRAPVTYWADLCNGDEVLAGGPDTQITIHYVDGRPDVIVEGRGGAHRVFSDRPVASQRGNFIAEIIEDLARRPWMHPRSTRTRGPNNKSSTSTLTLDIAGLNNGSALILSGERHPVLQWNGGLPPYSVVIKSAEGNTVIDEHHIWAGKDQHSHRLLMAKHTVYFAPGNYKLVITDAENATIEGKFQAVKDGIPGYSETNETDQAEASLLAGAALAHSRDPRFALEALFRLNTALSADWGVADVVANSIAKNP